MKVILRENVESLGNAGDVINVAPGYARNYLLPRGLATLATAKTQKGLEHQRDLQRRRAEKLRNDAESIRARIAALNCVFYRKAGETEKLFGSVTSSDIADFVIGAGVPIDRRRVQLGSPLKSLGTFEVPIRLHSDVTAHLAVHIEPQEPSP